VSSRFWRFALTALAGTLIVAFALALSYRQIATENLTEMRAEHNAELARSLSNALEGDLEALLSYASGVGADRLPYSPLVVQIASVLDERLEDLAVRRVNVFAPDGLVVFSTSTDRIGGSAAGNPGIVAALSGRVSTSIIRRDRLNEFDQVVEQDDLIQSYLPLRSDGGRIIGVLEIYSDVAPLLARISETQATIVLGVFSTLGAFYLLLVYMYRRTDRQLLTEQAAGEIHLRSVERARDELEQRVAERTLSLRKERDLMQRAIDGIKDPAIVTDLDYNVTIMNKAARDAFGSRLEPGGAIQCYHMLHNQDGPCQGADGSCAIHTQDSGRKLLVDKDGKTIEFRSTPLVDEDGNVNAVLEVAHSLSEHEEAALRLRREKEAAETASRVKSEFVATISHEIRTPMNAVLGMTDLLKLTQLTRRQRSYIQTIQSSGDMLLSLVDNVLDFSKLEAGALRLQEQEFDVVDLLERVLEIMGYPAGSKGLELIGTLRCDPGLRVCADKRRLRQILVNLVSNAVKFTEQGEIEIQIDATSEREGGLDLGFAVSDTGIGIDSKTRAQLFTPFASSERPASTQHYGSGLGLVICKRLVDNMGGSIDVRDRDGRGTTVAFSVPVARAMSHRTGEPAATGAPPLRQVLVVHANESAASSIRTYLHAWGVGSQLAFGASDALHKMRSAAAKGQPFDAAIVDAAITRPDPLLLARRIRETDETADLALILLTSITEPLEVGEVSQIGRLRCVNKPVLPLELRYNLLRSSLAGQEPATADETGEDAAPRGALSILVAEDNPVNRSVLISMLHSEGYDADVAEDGQAALRALQANDYDLLLMDCQMPGLDGDEVTRELRANPEKYAQPAVIVAVTADATEQHRAQCLDAGMDDFIPKPVRLDKLRSGLARWEAAARQQRRAGPVEGEISSIRAHLIERTGQVDDTFLSSYIGLFIDDTAERLQSLEAAVSEGDPMRIRREGHALKGACLEFGAERMARYCEDLSAAASSHNLAEASAVAQKLVQEFGRLRPVFESAASRVH